MKAFCEMITYIFALIFSLILLLIFTPIGWAVLCIDGNPQYMKFVRFERNDIRELQHFLKRFEYSKHVIDAPMLPKDFFINF